MNNCTVNITIPELHIDSTTPFLGKMSIIEMYVCIINVLLGFIIHFYVIRLIVKGKGIASEFFNLNLSVCEIGICLNCFSHILVIWFSGSKILKYFLSGLGITGRPLFQCLICVERYLAVIHPVIFLKFKSLRYRVICSTAAWIISLGSCLFSMFTLLSFNSYMYIWFFLIQFLLFLSIQLFCCSAVLRALKQSGPGERGREREREREEENHMKRRAFNLILITAVNMVIIYLPYCISGFYAILSQLRIEALWFFGFICYVVAGYVHPVLFLRRAGKLTCVCSL